MKKRIITFIGLAVLSGVASVGAMIGITVAAYTPPAETYTFDGNTTSVSSFSVGHYFHGGQGTSGEPYLITNPIEMRNFSKLQNNGILPNGKYYKLANSFNWYGDAMDSIGTSAKPFRGYFDGNSMTISGIEVTATSTSAGLFGVVYGANIHDIILSGPTINCTKASSKAGFIAGTSSSSSTITNAFVCGGSAGFAKRAIIKAGASAGGTATAPFIVGQSTNFTVTTSGFVLSVDNTSVVKTSMTPSGSSVTISSNSQKTFYASSAGIVVS